MYGSGGVAGWGDRVERARSAAVDMATALAVNMKSYISYHADAFEAIRRQAEGHRGEPTIRIDKHLSDMARKIAAQPRFRDYAGGGVEVYDEETSLQSGYDPKYENSLMHLIIDPLDGSSFIKNLGIGATSVLAYCRASINDPWQLLAGAVALNIGYVFSYAIDPLRKKDIQNGKFAGHVDLWSFGISLSTAEESTEIVRLDALDLDQAGRVDNKQPTSCMVSAAASDERRERAAWVTKNLDAKFCVNAAGNLCVFGALLGVTSIIIDPSRATMHDANYLFLLASNWEIYDINTGKLVHLIEKANKHCEPDITKEKRIPPVIAFRDHETAEDWLARRSADVEAAMGEQMIVAYTLDTDPLRELILGWDTSGRLLEIRAVTWEDGSQDVYYVRKARREYLTLLPQKES